MVDIEKVDGIIGEYIRSLHEEKDRMFADIIHPTEIPKDVHLIKVSCIRCHHSWYIRNRRFPQVCASCGSRYWNKPHQRELGFEYFGKRVYAHCRQCGGWLANNSIRHNKKGDIIQRFICLRCHIQPSINLTTEKNIGGKNLFLVEIEGNDESYGRRS